MHQRAQLAPIEERKSKRSDGKGHRPEGGINAATRDLGIERTEAQRSIKIDAIAPEARQAAIDAGLADNQPALLKIAAESTPEMQCGLIFLPDDRGVQPVDFRPSLREGASKIEACQNLVAHHAKNDPPVLSGRTAGHPIRDLIPEHSQYMGCATGTATG
jgi:ParB family chromosome partitioning protein